MFGRWLRSLVDAETYEDIAYSWTTTQKRLEGLLGRLAHKQIQTGQAIAQLEEFGMALVAEETKTKRAKEALEKIFS